MTRRTFLACVLLAPLVMAGCDESPERKAERRAFSACYGAVSRQAKYPSAADFGYYEVGTYRGGHRVVGRVELLNAFGAMIPHRYVCVYRGGRAEVVALRPG